MRRMMTSSCQDTKSIIRLRLRPNRTTSQLMLMQECKLRHNQMLLQHRLNQKVQKLLRLNQLIRMQLRHNLLSNQLNSQHSR